MGQTAEGRSPPVEQSVGSWDRGRGADPHTWTSALQHGVPPYREQKELLADDSVSSADATTALPTGSSVNDGGFGCSSISRADRQWNSWDGGVAASMGDCNSYTPTS